VLQRIRRAAAQRVAWSSRRIRNSLPRAGIFILASKPTFWVA